jgi:hypothetical protein
MFSKKLSVKRINSFNTSAFFLTQSEIQLIFSHGLDNDRDRKKTLPDRAIAPYLALSQDGGIS